MGSQHTDPIGEDDEQRSGGPDELAAFLMHHVYDPDMSDADRLQTYAIVAAHQEGDDPATVEMIMRDMALRFRNHADYRGEWRPREEPQPTINDSGQATSTRSSE